MKPLRPIALLAVAVLTGGLGWAQDWPQWRGPERTGVAEGGARLIDSAPESGLKEVWRSEPILGKTFDVMTGCDLGYSSPVVAAGRVFLYLNRKVKDESPFRLAWGMLDRLGCFRTPPPDDLARKVEAARTSPERRGLKSDEVPPWAIRWTARNLTHAEYTAAGERIADRLLRGDAALDFGALRKLAELKDKPYPKREDLAAALVDAGLGPERIAEIMKELGASRKRAFDVIFCFDAATGKTLWKKEYPGALFEYGTSSTPCVVGNRIFVSGGKTIYCLNTKDGSEVWQTPCPAREASSSPIVCDGILVIQAGSLCGLDAHTGELLWTRPEFTGIHASPAIWRKDGNAYAVQNCGLVELRTGRLIWRSAPSNDPSPVVSGDLLVANGIVCYRLGLGMPREPAWRVPHHMGRSTPVVYQGHVYGTQAENGPLFCVEVATGKVKWTSPADARCHTAAFNTPSCVIADGTIFIDDGYELILVRANPEKFELLGRAKVTRENLRASSPAIADGRLFLRGTEGLVCYDLTRAAGGPAPGAGQVGVAPHSSAPSSRTQEVAPRAEAQPSVQVFDGPRPAIRPTTARDWPQWRGFGRDGLSPNVPTQFSEATLLWQRPLPSKNPAGLAVAGGFVVAACHVGGEDQVRCFSADKGELLWTCSVPNPAEIEGGAGPRATPLIHDGRVYSVSAVGECWCLDLAGGSLRWKRSFSREFRARKPTWGHCSSPLMAEGKLIVSPLGPEAGIAALDPQTGATLWQTQGEGQPHASYVVGTFGGRVQIVGYDGRDLAGWEPAAGKKLWSVRPEKDNDYNVGTPLNVDGRLLVATENNGARLYAFEKDGSIVPKPVAVNEDLAPDMSTPVCVNGLVFGGRSEWLCLDGGTLKTLWTESAEEALAGFTMAIGGNGRLLVLNGEGQLSLLAANGQKCALLGKARVCGKTQSHPALAGGILYVRDDKALYSYDLRPPDKRRSER